jgi:hypothetical protein
MRVFVPRLTTRSLDAVPTMFDVQSVQHTSQPIRGWKERFELPLVLVTAHVSQERRTLPNITLPPFRVAVCADHGRHAPYYFALTTTSSRRFARLECTICRSCRPSPTPPPFPQPAHDFSLLPRDEGRCLEFSFVLIGYDEHTASVLIGYDEHTAPHLRRDQDEAFH